MKRKIIEYVKQNKLLYSIYIGTFQFMIRLLALFIPVKNRIFFVSFNGQRFDDSPRVMFEAMLSDKDFKGYDFVWALRNPEKYTIPGARVVDYDSLKYYIMAVSSKIWVTNVTVERGLLFKKKQTLYVNTWHGTPLKKLDQCKHKKRKSNIDIFCVQNKYLDHYFEKHFNLNPEALLFSDYPRNDELLNYTDEKKLEIRRRIGIDDDKRKIILYMPTYRPEMLSTKEKYIQEPVDFIKWSKRLASEYILVTRYHYLIESKMRKDNMEDFLVSASDYPILNDLYSVADILVSDYSSAFFDFCILQKPMLCYAYDYEKYSENPGFLLRLNELPCEVICNEDDLLNEIDNMDYDVYRDQTKAFKDKYAPIAGNACNILIKEIKKRLKGEKRLQQY